MAKQKNERSEKGSSKSKSAEGPVNAVVEQLVGRTGARGEVTQVIAKILSGKNEGRTMRRNVKGPVRLGDLLTLRETEIEAQRLKKGRVRSI